MTVRIRTGAGASLIALALGAALLGPATAGAAVTTVKGTLAKGKGFTVIGLSPDGTAVRDLLPASGKFGLRLKGRAAKRATLQLITRTGSYYGPVVLASKGSRVYTALAGDGGKVNLGKLKLRGDYAATSGRIGKRLLESGAVERRVKADADERGRPLGAGTLGLLPGDGQTARGRLAGPAGPGPGPGGPEPEGADPGGDPDADGIPNVSDADDNGNGILDQTDPSTPQEGGIQTVVFSGLPLEPEEAVNVNASGVTGARIDSILADNMRLAYLFFPRDEFSGETTLPGEVRNVDVDCFALSYCRRGAGTATTTREGLAPGADAPPDGSLWTDYDPDDDGLPNLPFTSSVGGGPAGYHIVVAPHATRAQIQVGDSYNYVIETSAGEVIAPETLTSFFVTSPAIAAHDDGSGPKGVTYPMQPGDPGTSLNPVQLTSESVRLSWWRPQRPTIPGAESGEFMDVGGLGYAVDLSVGMGGSEQIVQCRAAQWSSPSPTLTIGDTFVGSGDASLSDTGPDSAPSPENLLAATLDLGSCIRAAGTDPAGQRVLLRLSASDRARGNTSEFFHFQMPG